MMRFVFLLLAYFFLALGIIGIFLPGVPTVPFILLAAWFSARGSKPLHDWLYKHPHIGKLLIDWEKQKAISRTSKIAAVLMLAVSWIVMLLRVDDTTVLTAASVLFLIISIYIASRPEPS